MSPQFRSIFYKKEIKYITINILWDIKQNSVSPPQHETKQKKNNQEVYQIFNIPSQSQVTNYGTLSLYHSYNWKSNTLIAIRFQ